MNDDKVQNVSAAMAALAAAYMSPPPAAPRRDWTVLTPEEKADRAHRRAEHDKLRARRKLERQARKKARQRK